MSILTAAQRRFLRTAASVDAVRAHFVLTGGSALAEYFLHHRLSDDLDLFTAVPRAVPLAVEALREPLASAGFALHVVRSFDTFAELRVEGNAEALKIDLAQDTPFRLAPPSEASAEGLALDSLEDIAANKVGALFGRAEPKDFVDVYFLQREHAPLDALVAEARRKHVGMDDYWLAQAFARVQRVRLLPRMVRPVTIEEMQRFFTAAAERLMRGIAGS